MKRYWKPEFCLLIIINLNDSILRMFPSEFITINSRFLKPTQFQKIFLLVALEL